MVTSVCLAGATGWAGSALARSIAGTADLALVGAVSRKHAGRGLGEALREPHLTCPVYASTAEALANPFQKFAEADAKLIPQWEIIDYAHDDKVDAPSGTARELAARLSKVRHPGPTVPVDRTAGPREARGATLSGSHVHSLRLPGYVISAEVVFGMPDQRLTIRHDSGNSARPYVDGALLAIREVSTLFGVHRGLDSVLDI